MSRGALGRDWISCDYGFMRGRWALGRIYDGVEILPLWKRKRDELKGAGVCRKVFGVTCEEGRERKEGPVSVEMLSNPSGPQFFKIFAIMPLSDAV